MASTWPKRHNCYCLSARPKTSRTGCMSEVAACRCLKWGGSEWPSCWEMAAGKLQKIGCFVNISSADLQKTDPDPFSPPRFHGAEEIERVRIDWQTNLFFYSFLAFSFPPEKWYLIWSLFNDPKWLKLHILYVYCWADLVWYQGPLRARKEKKLSESCSLSSRNNDIAMTRCYYIII